MRRRLTLAVLLCLAVPAASAHKPSDSYLNVAVAAADLEVRWDIALRDLDFALGLDADVDGAITWGEVRARSPAIIEIALANLRLASNGRPCPLVAPAQLLIDDHSDGAYAVLAMRAQCAAPVTTLTIDYRLFADTDPQHRGLLNLHVDNTVVTAIFGPEHPQQTLAVSAQGRLSVINRYLREGIWHILIGYDHILFLLSLLLPAVTWRAERQWQVSTSLRAVVLDVAKIVTAFTLAHSLTLSAAVLGLVQLPSRLVEASIAVSVMVAAGANLAGRWHARRWRLAFLFGLIHGFGFAAVLQDLQLPAGALMLALGGFNLGVECGQLALVALFLPAAYALRGSRFYQRVVYQAGSSLIVLVALGWFIERAFAIRLMTW